MTSLADSLATSLRVDISPITECISQLARQFEQQQKIIQQQQDELRLSKQFEASVKQLLSQFKLTLEQLSLRMTRTEQKTDVSSYVDEMRAVCEQIKIDANVTRDVLVEDNEKLRKSMREFSDQLEIVNTQHEEVKSEMQKQKELSLNVKLYCDQTLNSVKTAIDSLEPQIRSAVQALGEDVEESMAERHREMREYVNTRHDIVYDRINKVEKRMVLLPDQEEVNDMRVRVVDVENGVRRVYAEVQRVTSGNDALRGELGTLQGVSRTLVGQVAGLKRFVATRKGGAATEGNDAARADDSTPVDGKLRLIEQEISHHLAHPTLRDDLSLTDASRDGRRGMALFDARDYAVDGIAELEEAMGVLDSVSVGVGVGAETKDTSAFDSATSMTTVTGAGTGAASAGAVVGVQSQLSQAQSVEREVIGHRIRQSEERLREAINAARIELMEDVSRSVLAVDLDLKAVSKRLAACEARVEDAEDALNAGLGVVTGDSRAATSASASAAVSRVGSGASTGVKTPRHEGRARSRRSTLAVPAATTSAQEDLDTMWRLLRVIEGGSARERAAGVEGSVAEGDEPAASAASAPATGANAGTGGGGGAQGLPALLPPLPSPSVAGRAKDGKDRAPSAATATPTASAAASPSSFTFTPIALPSGLSALARADTRGQGKRGLVDGVTAEEVVRLGYRLGLAQAGNISGVQFPNSGVSGVGQVPQFHAHAPVHFNVSITAPGEDARGYRHGYGAGYGAPAQDLTGYDGQSGTAASSGYGYGYGLPAHVPYDAELDGSLFPASPRAHAALAPSAASRRSPSPSGCASPRAASTTASAPGTGAGTGMGTGATRGQRFREPPLAALVATTPSPPLTDAQTRARASPEPDRAPLPGGDAAHGAVREYASPIVDGRPARSRAVAPHAGATADTTAEAVAVTASAPASRRGKAGTAGSAAHGDRGQQAASASAPSPDPFRTVAMSPFFSVMQHAMQESGKSTNSGNSQPPTVRKSRAPSLASSASQPSLSASPSPSSSALSPVSSLSVVDPAQLALLKGYVDAGLATLRSKMNRLHSLVARSARTLATSDGLEDAPRSELVRAGDPRLRMREAEHIIDICKTYSEQLYATLAMQLQATVRDQLTEVYAAVRTEASASRSECRDRTREMQRRVLELLLGKGNVDALLDAQHHLSGGTAPRPPAEDDGMSFTITHIAPPHAADAAEAPAAGSGGLGAGSHALGTAAGLVVHKGAEVPLVGADGRLYRGREGGTVIFSPVQNSSKGVFKTSVVDAVATRVGVVDGVPAPHIAAGSNASDEVTVRFVGDASGEGEPDATAGVGTATGTHNGDVSSAEGVADHGDGPRVRLAQSGSRRNLANRPTQPTQAPTSRGAFSGQASARKGDGRSADPRSGGLGGALAQSGLLSGLNKR